MAKSKMKQPQSNMEEECVQDGWVIVKKQKVTIFIPPLPVTQQSPIPNPGASPLHPIPTKQNDHITPPHLTIDKPTKPIPRNPHHKNPNFRKKLAICSALKTRKYCGNLVNSKMRALNLERKLKRAGGLNSWLESLGLGQFIKIFKCKRVGKVQLVNLTMKKLKDMGAVAVGPRRKLMHAIDCLW